MLFSPPCGVHPLPSVPSQPTECFRITAIRREHMVCCLGLRFLHPRRHQLLVHPSSESWHEPRLRSPAHLKAGRQGCPGEHHLSSEAEGCHQPAKAGKVVSKDAFCSLAMTSSSPTGAVRSLLLPSLPGQHHAKSHAIWEEGTASCQAILVSVPKIF